MREYSGTDMHAASGTLDEVRDWLLRNHHYPLAIRALWLDPITDRLHVKVEIEHEQQPGSRQHISDFTITPAEGAQISPSGWQPLGDPLPLVPYEDREAIPAIRAPNPAPAYYQPLVKRVNPRSTDQAGVLRWRDAGAKQTKKERARLPLRLVHDSLIMPTTAKIPESRRQAHLDFHYNLLCVACRAPPWHPQAGYFLVSAPSSPHLRLAFGK